MSQQQVIQYSILLDEFIKDTTPYGGEVHYEGDFILITIHTSADKRRSLERTIYGPEIASWEESIMRELFSALFKALWDNFKTQTSPHTSLPAALAAGLPKPSGLPTPSTTSSSPAEDPLDRTRRPTAQMPAALKERLRKKQQQDD